jgi:hypothetical protein
VWLRFCVVEGVVCWKNIKYKRMIVCIMHMYFVVVVMQENFKFGVEQWVCGGVDVCS